MTLEDAPTDAVPQTRRARRAATGEVTTTPAATAGAPAVTSTATEVGAAPASAPQAFAWLDASTVLARTYAPKAMESATAAQPVVPDLIGPLPRRSAFRPSVSVPILLVLLVAAAYTVTSLVWPLNAVPPVIEAGQVTTTPAPPASPAWPATGSAAVGVEGIGATAASTDKTAQIASITKVVTALLVLDEMPLAVGEQGPKYFFSSSDYARYVANGESALKVPVGGSLTQYQLLEGMLIGSANNYADRLASELWPTDAVYAAAANQWLSDNGLEGITVVNPSGFSKGNKATPAALLALADKALQNPVIAEIVAKKSVKLPGAGTVKNTNALLADPGVVGIKTGTLSTYSSLTAKDITIGDTTVRTYASVLGQKNNAARVAAARALYAQLETELQPTTAVPAGTHAGGVTTAWGEKVDVVTASDAQVVLWNGASAAATVNVDLGDKSEKGDIVGSLVVTGPLNSQTVELALAEDVEGPSPWWRLTHPLELFGIGR